MKIAYIGIDLLYPALPALEEAGCEIAEIFTCATDNETEFNLQITAFAKERNIPYTTERMTGSDIARLKQKGCEMAVCGGYYYRLPVDPDFPIINIHPALLPVGRGAWPMPLVILRGMTETGITLHRVAPGFDEGDILLQETVAVSPEDDLESLTAKLTAPLPAMMKTLVSDFDALLANARPQGEGEYWPCPDERDYPITPDTPYAEADLILRAFYGYRCIYQRDGETLALIRGRAYPVGDGLPIRGGVIRAKKMTPLSSTTIER